jgi:hypothetical protein
MAPKLSAVLSAIALAITLYGAGGVVEAQPSALGLDDPLAPGGVKIGEKLADVDHRLTSAGYGKGHSCSYGKGDRKGGGHKRIDLRAGRQCEANALVSRVSYSENSPTVYSEKPPDLVKRISRTLGVEQNKCSVLLEAQAQCTWLSPPTAPLVREIRLSSYPQSLSITLTGVDEQTAAGSSRPADATSGSGKPESASRPADMATRAAAAPQQGRFELEGVELGMTPAQVTAALQAKGFVPVDGGKGGGFVKEGATTRGAEKTRGGATYLRPTGQYRAEQAEQVRISYPKGKEREVKKHPLFGELIAKYGQPDECTERSCTWVRQADGWVETLELQLSLMINVMLKATAVDRAKFSQLAAGASVPSSAESQSAPTSAKGPSSPQAVDFDALGPHGVRVGMSYSDVEAALKAARFSGGSGGCAWYRAQGTQTERMSFQVAGQRGSRCQGGALVDLMEYTLSDSRGLGAPPENFIASMNRQIGTDASCKEHKQSNKFECKWLSLTNAPFAGEISVSLNPGAIFYRARAKQGAQSSTPAPSAHQEAQTWWTQELAKAEAKGLGKEFAQSEQFKQLPADRQAQLSEQARTVYGYCKNREPFRDLHDCSCVADKFVDARMKAPIEKAAPRPPDPTCAPGDQACLVRAKTLQRQWENEEKARQNRMNDNSQTGIIALADREAHQCPSKAGVASFSHRQCIATYGRRMSQDDLKSFCMCYADNSATQYMKEPVASFATLNGAGAAAILDCAKQGYPSPLPGKSSGSQKKER